MGNYIKHEKFHSIGVHTDTPSLEELKEKALQQLLDLPAVLGRGAVDHLIEYDGDSKLVWRDNLLKQMDISNLNLLRNLIENRLELQQKIY